MLTERRPDAVVLMDVNGFTALNKQLFRGNSSSFNESTAYLLVFYMFYTKKYFGLNNFLSLNFYFIFFIPMRSVNSDWVSHNSTEIQCQGCNVIGY